jgi:hypothetical protein
VIIEQPEADPLSPPDCLKNQGHPRNERKQFVTTVVQSLDESREEEGIHRRTLDEGRTAKAQTLKNTEVQTGSTTNEYKLQISVAHNDG